METTRLKVFAPSVKSYMAGTLGDQAMHYHDGKDEKAWCYSCIHMAHTRTYPLGYAPTRRFSRKAWNNTDARLSGAL
jgi:hypothetical protein